LDCVQSLDIHLLLSNVGDDVALCGAVPSMSSHFSPLEIR
jgi:hypothetical protein